MNITVNKMNECYLSFPFCHYSEAGVFVRNILFR